MVHMIGAGIYLGASYDTFGVIRRNHSSGFSKNIADILFWIWSGLLVFIWLQTVNAGEVRVYIFICLLLGFAVYKAVLQRTYTFVLQRIVVFIQHVCYVVKVILHFFLFRPIRAVCLTLLSILSFFIFTLLKEGNKIYRLIFKEKNDEKRGFRAWMTNWFK